MKSWKEAFEDILREDPSLGFLSFKAGFIRGWEERERAIPGKSGAPWCKFCGAPRLPAMALTFKMTTEENGVRGSREFAVCSTCVGAVVFAAMQASGQSPAFARELGIDVERRGTGLVAPDGSPARSDEPNAMMIVEAAVRVVGEQKEFRDSHLPDEHVEFCAALDELTSAVKMLSH